MGGLVFGRSGVRRLAAALLGAALALSTPRPAAAQIGSDRYASIVVDAATGTILSAVNADEYRYPASLTKMMTIYMLFEALRDRRLSLNQQVPVSSWAASMSPTKLGLLPSTIITVEQALLGLVTKSANDAAAALGELLGGDEERFAEMMSLRARALGMTRTTFRNASGLPDWGQVTTARDMAVLARHLVQDFPAYYRYFSVPSFVFQRRTVMNHQHLLQTYPGADGLKTGYIVASGYNVVTSAVRSDTRLIGVVMGASSGGERDAHMAVLLDQGFERMGVPPVFLARREEPPRFGGSFISLAQAAPLIAPRLPVSASNPVMPHPDRRNYAIPIRQRPEPRYAEPRNLAPARSRLAPLSPRVTPIRATPIRTAAPPGTTRPVTTRPVTTRTAGWQTARPPG